MDPVSQMAFGTVFAQSLKKQKKNFRTISITGALGGLAPDADILVRSSTDPLLYIEYHRHFTHSLTFIPFGGLIVSLILFPFFKRKLDFKSLYIFTTIGYATHAVLDACTSYGTQLLWPFTNMRISWDVISIIDPIFTVPLVLFILLALFLRNRVFSFIGIFCCLFYLGLGKYQKIQAKEYVKEFATLRGHVPTELGVKPSFANILVWKSIYNYKGTYYVDAVRVFGSDRKLYQGEEIQKLDLTRDFPWLDKTSQHAIDVERFRWFSQGYLGVHPEFNDIIGDVRYSLLPNEISPLWGIRLDRDNQDKHVDYVTLREVSKERQELLVKMIKGEEI